MRKEIIEAILAILVIISMAFGADAYFAKQSEMSLVSAKQQLHFLSHAIQEIQTQIWQIENRYGTSDCFKYSPRDRDTYRKLLKKLENLRKQESILLKKGG